jgi:hypothetical protein
MANLGCVLATRHEYEKWVRFALEHCKVFLSINHEAISFRVHDYPKMVGLPGIKRTRHACPVRPGYVEESFYPPKPNRFRLPWRKRKMLFADVTADAPLKPG